MYRFDTFFIPLRRVTIEVTFVETLHRRLRRASPSVSGEGRWAGIRSTYNPAAPKAEGLGQVTAMPRFRIDAKPLPARRFVLKPDAFKASSPYLTPTDTRPACPPLPTRPDGPYRYSARTSVARAETPKRTPKRRVQAQTGARGLFTVSAPVGPRKGRTVLDFVAADETPMQSFMGTLALRINPDAVNLGRLELGLLSLAIDHDASRLMGRITEATIVSGQLAMLAEVGDTPTAISAMSEIDDLTRAGFSPGFIIHETEVIDPDHPDYDEKEMFQIEVTRWEPYEISSSAIPRNPNARLKGVASMNSNVITGAPELVSTSDVLGLSLAAGRAALRSGTGSDAQREKLEKFYEAFQLGLEAGLSRDVAAQAAKLAVGL